METAAPGRVPDEIDIALLDYFLSLSPIERLEMNDNSARELTELRQAAEASVRNAEATKFGGLHVFGMIGNNHTHLDLLPSAILFDIEPSFDVPMLSAAALLAEKRPMIRNDEPQERRQRHLLASGHPRKTTVAPPARLVLQQSPVVS